MKTCTRCLQRKSLGSFGRRTDTVSTCYESQCRDCKSRRNKKDYQRNKPIRRRRHSEWREKNRMKIREYVRAWARRNPNAIRSNVAAYRARKKSAFVEVVSLEWLLQRQNYYCGICEGTIFDNPSIDHVLPLSKGGTHEYDNVQAVHLKCNIRKGAKTY